MNIPITKLISHVKRLPLSVVWTGTFMVHPHSAGLYCVPIGQGICIHPWPGTYCSNLFGTSKIGRESHDPRPAVMGGQASVQLGSVVQPT